MTRQSRILQIMPSPDHLQMAWVDQDGNVCRDPVVCLALKETWNCSRGYDCEGDHCGYLGDHTGYETSVDPLDYVDGAINDPDGSELVSSSESDAVIRDRVFRSRSISERMRQERADLVSAGWQERNGYWRSPDGTRHVTTMWQAHQILNQDQP